MLLSYNTKAFDIYTKELFKFLYYNISLVYNKFFLIY